MSKAANQTFHLLIPAAGSGTRAGDSIPKQYRRIAGKMVLRHTLEKFMGIQGLKTVRVIIDPEHAHWYGEAVQGMDLGPAALMPPVFGARTRKQSVYNGLASYAAPEQNDLLLIHDAARPFVSAGSIYALLDAMTQSVAATLAAPIADTLVDADYNPFDRDKISAVQTPQGFKISLLKRAHDLFKNDDRFSDDAGLIAAIGEQVTLIPGPRDNFKITTAEDVLMAERILAPRLETRTGFGYDVHAFDPAPANKIRLCGIDIPFDKKLLGHSDADVALHALTDALLGAIGEGDIGQLFPSDMQWKGADSAIFLKEALRRVRARGGNIVHVDLTIIAEAPKIGPHRDAMKSRIADILGINSSRVGLKATTSEGLGFTGRGEGIAAHALATITLPLES